MASRWMSPTCDFWNRPIIFSQRAIFSCWAITGMTVRTAAIGDSYRGKILSASLWSFTGPCGTGTKIHRRRFKAGSITSRTPSLTSFRSRAGTARFGWYTEYFHRWDESDIVIETQSLQTSMITEKKSAKKEVVVEDSVAEEKPKESTVEFLSSLAA